MCIIGVAAGVALSVAVRVQTASYGQGQQQTERALVGEASTEAVARGPSGMPMAVFRAVERLPGVEAAAPVSVQNVAVEGPSGRSVVRLIGVDRRLKQIGSPVGSEVAGRLQAQDLGLYLQADLARELGLRRGDPVSVVGPAGRRATVVSETSSRLSDQDIGSAPVVVAPLGLVQTLTGQEGRITRLLIRESSHTPADRRALRAAIGQRGDLRSPGWESALLAQASELFRLSLNLFAMLCVLLGGIVVYAVTLLTSVDRRREIATLAALGCAPKRLIGVLVGEAVVVGAAGAALGTLLGWGLVRALGSLPSAHLSFAFTFSDRLHLGWSTAAAGIVGGVAVSIAATLVASAGLAFEPPANALSTRPETPGHRRRRTRLTGASGVAALLLGGVISLVAPRFGIVAVCLASAGTVLVVPGVLALLMRIIERALRQPGGAGRLGISELLASPARGAAMAIIVAVVVMGIITISSSNRNFERGSDALADDVFSHTPLWATTSGNDAWLTRAISPAARDVLRAQPGVAAVRDHRTVLLDWQGRRVFVYSLDTGRPTPPPGSDLQRRLVGPDAGRLLSEGAGILMSSGLARERGVAPGDRVTLPTPSGPREVTIAGYVSNYGWQPGAIELSSVAIDRWWREPSLTALQVDLSAGAETSAVRKHLQAVAAPLGLEIDVPDQLRQRIRDAAKGALTPMGNVAWMISILGVLALAATLVAAIMQRARRLATLRAIGMEHRQVLRSLTAESAAITLAGALAGLAGGLFAHRLTIDYLVEENGFPYSYALEPGVIAVALGLAGAAALTVPWLSLWWLSKVPVRNSFADA